MNESKLSSALLEQGGVVTSDEAERVIRRERRLITWLTAAAALLWLVAVTGLSVVYGGFIFLILPKVNQLLTSAQDPEQASRGWRAVIHAMVDVGHPIVLTTLCTILLAALATVGLIFYSRRATVRQMSAALAAISTQLRELLAAREKNKSERKE